MNWSPVNVVMLAAAVAGALSAIAAIAITRRQGRETLARQLTQILAGAAAGYVVLLLGVSLAARETILPADEPKWFCGFYLECHRGVRVTGVAAAPTVGESHAARGLYYIVTLQVENSALRVPLRLRQPDVRVITDDGRTFPRDHTAERALGAEDSSLTAEIAPGGSAAAVLVFDVPVDAPNPRLLITDNSLLPDRVLETLLIGDEDSFLHPPTTFALDERTRRVGGVRWRIGTQGL